LNRTQTQESEHKVGAFEIGGYELKPQ
jgi:hypothetical protein